MRIGRDVTELVGQTPMVQMNRRGGSSDAEIWAKLETMNRGGSSKEAARTARGWGLCWSWARGSAW
jgi:cysteine synthase